LNGDFNSESCKNHHLKLKTSPLLSLIVSKIDRLELKQLSDFTEKLSSGLCDRIDKVPN
jgi:hypothetical protein